MVHSAKRRRNIATKRLDPREHQNWGRIGSCNLLVARQIWSRDQNHVHEQRQFSLLGQNFSWRKQVGHELNNNEHETSEVQFEEYALKLNASDFACRSKAKAKPQRREPAGSSTTTTPIGERIWTDVEPGEY